MRYLLDFQEEHLFHEALSRPSLLASPEGLAFTGLREKDTMEKKQGENKEEERNSNRR
jgi:hypothetical protein